MSNDMAIDDHVPRRLNEFDAGMVRKNPRLALARSMGQRHRRAASINSPACA